MTGPSPGTPCGVDALSTFEALEVEYASARIFRRLLIPRILLVTAAVGGVVMLARLAWQPLLLLLGVDSGLIAFAVQRERHARRRWTQGFQRLSRSLGIQPQTGIRPTVQ